MKTFKIIDPEWESKEHALGILSNMLRMDGIVRTEVVQTDPYITVEVDFDPSIGDEEYFNQCLDYGEFVVTELQPLDNGGMV